MADEDDQNEEGNENPDAEGEGGEGEEGEEGEGKKGGKKKLLILILVPLLLIGGGGGAAYYMGFLDSLLGIEKKEECHDDHGEVIECPHDEEDHAEKGEGKDKKDKKKDKKKGDGKEGGDYGDGEDSQFLAVAPMVVNLSTEDDTPRLLRLKIQLELADPSEAGDVKAVMPRVIDQFQTYLRGLRVRDLKGSAGIYRLQIELLNRVNKAVAPIEIKDVLFQEILIQ